MSRTHLPDGQEIRTRRQAEDLTQEGLAVEIGHNVRTIQNAERGRSAISEAILKKISKALKCELMAIVKPKSAIDQHHQPGTSKFYADALKGVWLANCEEESLRNEAGEFFGGGATEWEVQLETDNEKLSGFAVCRTIEFSHQAFKLIGEVNGRGFVTLDGRRDEPGSYHMFRAILEYHDDTYSKIMTGGFVVYEVEYREFFVGHLRMERKATVPT